MYLHRYLKCIHVHLALKSGRIEMGWGVTVSLNGLSLPIFALVWFTYSIGQLGLLFESGFATHHYLHIRNVYQGYWICNSPLCTYWECILGNLEGQDYWHRLLVPTTATNWLLLLISHAYPMLALPGSIKLIKSTYECFIIYNQCR